VHTKYSQQNRAAQEHFRRASAGVAQRAGVESAQGGAGRAQGGAGKVKGFWGLQGMARCQGGGKAMYMVPSQGLGVGVGSSKGVGMGARQGAGAGAGGVMGEQMEGTGKVGEVPVRGVAPCTREGADVGAVSYGDERFYRAVDSMEGRVLVPVDRYYWHKGREDRLHYGFTR